MKYKLNFRVPPSASTVRRQWDGVDYTYETVPGAPPKASVKISAAHERQAFVIGQSIAKKNGWSMNGQPVKTEF